MQIELENTFNDLTVQYELRLLQAKGVLEDSKGNAVSLHSGELSFALISYLPELDLQHLYATLAGAVHSDLSQFIIGENPRFAAWGVNFNTAETEKEIDYAICATCHITYSSIANVPKRLNNE